MTDYYRRGSRAMAIVTHVLGFGLLLTGGVLVYVLICIWPAVVKATAADVNVETASRIDLFGFVHLNLIPDAALLLLVVVTSALGSFVHAATSFGTYVGNRALTSSWVWWYLLRVFIGVALATIFYLAIRGGFLAAQADTSDVNPYGMAALSGLVGLFSKQAADKLEEVFTTLFRVGEHSGDSLRKDKVAFPVPRLVSVEPKAVPRRSGASLRLLGEGFSPESAVRVSRRTNGRTDVITDQRVTSDTTIDLTIEARYLDEPGQLELAVVNPAPGGGTSNSLVLTVEDVEPDAGTTPRRRTLLGRRRPRGNA